MANDYGNVSVTESGDGITINIRGQKIDARTIEGCIQAILQCGCLSNGININAKCLEVIQRHEQESGCVSNCFGCQ